MAIVKFSVGQFPVTGKQDGVIFSKHRNSSVIKGYYSPREKQSSKISLNRARFAGIVNDYKNLTLLQKNSFNDETQNYLRSNSYGFNYELSGYNLFVSSGINKEKTQDQFLSTMATKLPAPSFSVTDIDIDFINSIFSVQFSTNTVPAGFNICIIASEAIPLSSTGNDFALLRIIYVAGPGVSLPSDFYNLYTGAFGNVSSLSNVRLKFIVQLVQVDTGQVVLAETYFSDQSFASGFPYIFPFSLG